MVSRLNWGNNTDSRSNFRLIAACVMPLPCRIIVCWIIVPNHDGISIALAKLGHPSSSTNPMYHSEDCVVSHSITCSSDPFFRDIAVRKLAAVGCQCIKNNKTRARTSGKCTLEHIQSTAQTDNYTKSYPKCPWPVFIWSPRYRHTTDIVDSEARPNAYVKTSLHKWY